jgi:polyisoprenoid-binding protein YceI
MPITPVTGSKFHADLHHTQVGFSVLHLGFTRYDGVFSNASGQLTLDPKTLNATALDVTVPVASVQTTSTKLDGELKSDQWLNADKFFPTTYVPMISDDVELTINAAFHKAP